MNDREMGAKASKEQVAAFLTGYLGDSFFAEQFTECISLLRGKNSDYTEGQGQRDRIKHFRDAANKHELPMTKIWSVFVDKHWSAVQKFIKSGQTESEPIEGRIQDVINYMVLLLAIIEDGR